MKRKTGLGRAGGQPAGVTVARSAQPALTNAGVMGRRCKEDLRSVYTESSHSVGLGFCATPEAQRVPVTLARKWCGGCH